MLASGVLTTRRCPVVRTPVANIGRADYNDLMSPDESVSTSHAKLQRREGVWVLVDLDSTNGTFVDGDRVKGETAISPGVTVRFGDIALVFEPTDDAAGTAKGSGTRVLEAMKPAAKAAPAPAAAAPSKPKPKAPPKAPVAEKKKGKGCGGSAAVLVMAFVAVVYWVLI